MSPATHVPECQKSSDVVLVTHVGFRPLFFVARFRFRASAWSLSECVLILCDQGYAHSLAEHPAFVAETCRPHM